MPFELAPGKGIAITASEPPRMMTPAEYKAVYERTMGITPEPPKEPKMDTTEDVMEAPSEGRRRGSPRFRVGDLVFYSLIGDKGKVSVYFALVFRVDVRMDKEPTYELREEESLDAVTYTRRDSDLSMDPLDFVGRNALVHMALSMPDWMLAEASRNPRNRAAARLIGSALAEGRRNPSHAKSAERKAAFTRPGAYAKVEEGPFRAPTFGADGYGRYFEERVTTALGVTGKPARKDVPSAMRGTALAVLEKLVREGSLDPKELTGFEITGSLSLEASEKMVKRLMGAGYGVEPSREVMLRARSAGLSTMGKAMFAPRTERDIVLGRLGIDLGRSMTPTEKKVVEVLLGRLLVDGRIPEDDMVHFIDRGVLTERAKDAIAEMVVRTDGESEAALEELKAGGVFAFETPKPAEEREPIDDFTDIFEEEEDEREALPDDTRRDWEETPAEGFDIEAAARLPPKPSEDIESMVRYLDREFRKMGGGPSSLDLARSMTGTSGVESPAVAVLRRMEAIRRKAAEAVRRPDPKRPFAGIEEADKTLSDSATPSEVLAAIKKGKLTEAEKERFHEKFASEPKSPVYPTSSRGIGGTPTATMDFEPEDPDPPFRKTTYRGADGKAHEAFDMEPFDPAKHPGHVRFERSPGAEGEFTRRKSKPPEEGDGCGGGPKKPVRLFWAPRGKEGTE